MAKASDISDAAAQWLIRLEGQTTPEIWDSFQAWVDADIRHRAEFIRLREAWKRTDLLKNMRPANGTIDSDLLARDNISGAALLQSRFQPLQGKARQRPQEPIMPDRRRVVGLAAAIAATGVIAWFGTYHLGWYSHETGIGERQQFALADGTTVDLNTNSALDEKISASRRDIVLTRGEALFHVAHDNSRPFYVTAAGTVVRAVGTAFSVRIRDAEHVDVLVEEGRVAVGAPETEANFENPSLLSAAPKFAAGEAASVHRKSITRKQLPPQEIQRKLAWTAGYLAFQGETLADAVQEFNRYNQRQITIADPAILNRQVGGNFSTSDLDGFAAALRHLYGVTVQTGDNNGDIKLFAGTRPP